VRMSVRMRPTVTAAALALALGLGAACNDSPTSPTGAAGFTRTDLQVGEGAEAAAGAIVTVHYTGWLYNPDRPNQRGAQFDSSAGREPFTFRLGVGQVIQGWDQGLPGMRIGGMRRLVIPPSLGYGASRSGPIPPNATLLFDVELLAIQ
jgi:FKBP-type peptidyl-prolyl cis-trans isomerase FkpA